MELAAVLLLAVVFLDLLGAAAGVVVAAAVTLVIDRPRGHAGRSEVGDGRSHGRENRGHSRERDQHFSQFANHGTKHLARVRTEITPSQKQSTSESGRGPNPD